jgi:hypothetical protein
MASASHRARAGLPFSGSRNSPPRRGRKMRREKRARDRISQ